VWLSDVLHEDKSELFVASACAPVLLVGLKYVQLCKISLDHAVLALFVTCVRSDVLDQLEHDVITDPIMGCIACCYIVFMN